MAALANDLSALDEPVRNYLDSEHRLLIGGKWKRGSYGWHLKTRSGEQWRRKHARHCLSAI